MQIPDVLVLTAPAPNAVSNGAGQVVGSDLGITTYYYWIVTHYPIGASMGGPVFVRNAPNSLSLTNFVQVIWNEALGATHYDVLRTENNRFPEEPGFYAVALDLTDPFCEDQGQALLFYDPRGLPFGAPVSRNIYLNNRDYAQPTMELDAQLKVTQIIFSDGTIQDTAGVPGPDVPTDGIAYGREDGLWVPVVRLSGDTMTGPLILSEDPVLPMQAATKGYVDLNFVGEAPFDNNAYGRYHYGWIPTVQLWGDTMTGPLILSSDPTLSLGAATKQYVDSRITGALFFIGSIDASTGDCTYTTDSGFTNGPVVPAASIRNGFLIDTTPGTIPSGPAAGITLNVGDWLLSDGTTWTALRVGEPAITASLVAVIPPQFSADNVQGALANAQNDVNARVKLSGGLMTGGLILNGDPTAPLMAVTKQYVDARMQLATAAEVSVAPPVFGASNVQDALANALADLNALQASVSHGLLADVQPNEMVIPTTGATWATINVTGLPANSTRRFLWLCQPNLYNAGTEARTYSFSVPGIFSTNRQLIQAGPPSGGQYPAFQVWLIGSATTDATGAVNMPINVSLILGNPVNWLGNGGGISLRSRIQVFDMGSTLLAGPWSTPTDGLTIDEISQMDGPPPPAPPSSWSAMKANLLSIWARIAQVSHAAFQWGRTNFLG